MVQKIISFKVPPAQENALKEEAKEAGLNISDLIRDKLKFVDSFDPFFLRHMKSVAEKMNQPVAIVIQNFLTVYIATESAALEAYGTTPTIYKRAFQYSKTGELITGNDLSNLAFDQATENLNKLKKKLEESAQTGKAAKITFEEAAFIADHRESDQAAMGA